MVACLLRLSFGLALVLVLRRPARRLFGAGPAFTLWLWPPLLACLPFCPLPALAPAWGGLSPMPVVASAAHAMAAASPVRPALWPALWLAGAAVAALRLVVVYVRLRRDCRPPTAAIRDAVHAAAPSLDPRRLRIHAQGPAVLWAPRSLVLLPPDFAAGDRHRRHVVLAHESSHLQRLDPLWMLLAETLAALLWFHPLAWLALPRFRLDQELACDERTLRRAGIDPAGYARALLAGTGMGSSPTLIPWLAASQLKERLRTIRRHRAGTPLRWAGTLVLGLGGAGLALAAQTAPPLGASADLDFNLRVPPQYPKASIVNNEQGTVTLEVLVGVDGRVKRVDYDPARSSTTSDNLVAAASEAAMHWRFDPASRDGVPIESYARVPVQFSLDRLPDPAERPKLKKDLRNTQKGTDLKDV